MSKEYSLTKRQVQYVKAAVRFGSDGKRAAESLCIEHRTYVNGIRNVAKKLELSPDEPTDTLKIRIILTGLELGYLTPEYLKECSKKFSRQDKR